MKKYNIKWIAFTLFLYFGTVHASDPSYSVLDRLVADECHNITEINQEACGFGCKILSSLSRLSQKGPSEKSITLDDEENRSGEVTAATFINSSQDSVERGKARSKRSVLNEEGMAKAMPDEEDRAGEAAADRIPDEFMKVAATAQRIPNTITPHYKYLSISVNYPGNHQLEVLSSNAKKIGVDFYFWQINDSYIEIEPTDLLILNALRTYHHTHFALNTFAKNVRKYIYIPYQCDKEFFFEDDYFGNYLEYPATFINSSEEFIKVAGYPISIKNSGKKGVWQAISEFINSHPDWGVKRDENTGTWILFRLDNSPPLSFDLDPNVDYYLNNKIILCTGPSLGRYKMLKEIVEHEMHLIPYKKIFVSTNDDRIMDIKFLHIKPQCRRIPCIEKYVDCWNCIITSLRDAVNDPQVCDDDIILFKHETVFLNDLGLFKRALSKMLSHNMIVRLFWGGATSDIFLVKVSAIKNLIQPLSILSNIHPNEYVEMMLRKKIVNNISNIYCIKLGSAPFIPTNTSSWGSNGFGFYHYHNYFKFSKSRNEVVDIFGQEFWKKNNYQTLFEENHTLDDHEYYDSFTKYYIDFMRLRPDLDTIELAH